MSDIAIRAANLSKLYHIGRGQGKAGYRTLRESMMAGFKRCRIVKDTFLNTKEGF